MTTEQPRIVMDQAAANKRRQDIIEAMRFVVIAAIGLIPTFDETLLTSTQMGQIMVLLGAVFVALQVIIGRRSIKDALDVEAQVTPGVSPRTDDGVPLVPIADDGYDDDAGVPF